MQNYCDPVGADQNSASKQGFRLLQPIVPPEGDTQGMRYRWLIWKMLEEEERATESVRRFEDKDVPYKTANWLVYHTFDPRPFPGLMAVLERENIDRLPPPKIPYSCPAKS